MLIAVTLTGLPNPSTLSRCAFGADAPVVREALTIAEMPDAPPPPTRPKKWVLPHLRDEQVARMQSVVREIAAVPADEVAQEVNGLWPRTIQTLMRKMTVFPAWGGEVPDGIDYNVVIDYAGREIRIASADGVECIGFDD